MTDDRVIAHSFMQALWAADLETCDRMMSTDAKWHFQLGMPQAQMRRGRIWPARDALRQIVDDLFGKFNPEGFTVTPMRLIGEQGLIAIEYEARGTTAKGAAYHNYYVTVLSIRNGLVDEIRPYNDTKHMLEILSD